MIKQRGVVVFIQFVFLLLLLSFVISLFFWGVGVGRFSFFIISIVVSFFCLFVSLLLLRHSICNISRTANHTGVMLLGDPDSQEHKHTMYTFTSRRQAHQHRRLLVNVFRLFLQVGLWSAPSTPPLPPDLFHISSRGRSLSRGRTATRSGEDRESAPRRLTRRGCRGRKRETQRGEKALTRSSVDGKG